MKKFYYSMFAAASMMLAVTSCSQEENFAPQSSNVTRFSLQLDGATQSRTAGDGQTVDKLYYAVYDKTTSNVIYPAGENYGTAVKVDGGWTLELPLMKSETYDILFWAQKEGSNAYTFDFLTDITVNYTDVLSNKEDRDAFFNALDDFTASGSEHTIILRRPFAQLNIATTMTDWNKAKEIYNSNNGTVDAAPVSASTVTVKSLAETFNVMTGKAENATNVTFGTNNLIDEEITINDVKYKLLAMNYLLPVGEKAPNGVEQYEKSVDKDMVEVEFTLYKGQNEQIVNVKVPATPIQRNWRTNIIGSLLTGEGFDIIIDEEFDETENQEIEIFADGIVEDAEGNYHITKPEGLWAFANLVNNGSTPEEGRAVTNDYTFYGKTFNLDCDINLQGTEWTPIDNFDGTFDGNGKTISNFKVNKKASAGLFGSLAKNAKVKNLTVTEATIVSCHHAGVIVGHGYVAIENCHVKNSSVTLTTELIDGSHDNGDKAGAIIGYLCEEVAANAQTGIDYVKNCSAENVTIRGYRDIGGLVGIANGTAFVTNNQISNSVIVIDKANNYKNYTSDAEFHGGEVVGETATNATVENNTATSVEITYINGDDYIGYYVDANGNYCATESKGISAAINEGVTNIHLNEGIYIIPSEAKEKTLTFIGASAENTIVDINSDSKLQYVNGSTINFENITIECAPQSAGYDRGFAHANSIAYKNCVIDGTLGLYSNSTFENCTFNISGNYYNVWTWGAPKATFTGCTFNSDGKAMLLYGQVNTELTINDCVFNDNGGLTDKKAAIEIGNDYNKSYTLIVNNTVVNGYEINDKGINTGTTLFGNKNSMGNDVLTVIVDGWTFVDTGLWIDTEDNYIAFNSVGLQTALNNTEVQTISLAEGVFEGTIVAKTGKTIIGSENSVVHCINLCGADNVTLENITFDAANAKRGYDNKGEAKQYANIITGDNTNKANKGSHNLVIDGCTFTGTFANGGASIAFTDYYRTGGFSGNITIKNCTFDTENAYYNIYGHYTGNGLNGYGDFIIENNIFATTFTQGGAIYLGRYASSTPVVVKGNDFKIAKSLKEAMNIQDHSNYGVSIAAENNTFAE